MSDETTGADGVVEAVPVLVVGVLSFHEDILVAHVLRPLVDHPGPGLHPDGVAAVEVGAELRTVAAAFVVTTLEVLVLIKEDLQAGVCLCVRTSPSGTGTAAALSSSFAFGMRIFLSTLH